MEKCLTSSPFKDRSGNLCLVQKISMLIKTNSTFKMTKAPSSKKSSHFMIIILSHSNCDFPFPRYHLDLKLLLFSLVKTISGEKKLSCDSCEWKLELSIQTHSMVKTHCRCSVVIETLCSPYKIVFFIFTISHTNCALYFS